MVDSGLVLLRNQLFDGVIIEPAVDRVKDILETDFRKSFPGLKSPIHEPSFALFRLPPFAAESPLTCTINLPYTLTVKNCQKADSYQFYL